MGLGGRGVSASLGESLVGSDSGLSSSVASLTSVDVLDGIHSNFSKNVHYTKVPLAAALLNSVSSIYTFTGGNQSMYMGPNGLLVQSVTNTPRIEYTSQTVGKNNLLSSNSFETGNWGKGFGYINPNVAQGPLQNTLGSKWVEDTTQAFHTLSQTMSWVSGFAYTYSIYAKAAERPAIQLILPSGAFGGSQSFGFFDLVAGVVFATQNVSASSITSIGNGWYRCSITQTASTTTSLSVQTAIAMSTVSASSNFYTGNGSGGIYIYGAQVEIGSAPSVYANVPFGTAAPQYANSPPVCSGILSENTRTNLILQSQDFATTWAIANASVSSNTATAPDGTSTADKISVTAGTLFGRAEQVVAVSAGVFYTLSVFVKPSPAQWVIFRLAEDTAPVQWFDLSTGTVGSSQGNWSLPTITSYPNGWFRISARYLTIGASYTFRIGPVDNGAATAYTSDGTQGILIWGAQLEQANFQSSYIPTTTVSVARSTDICSRTLSTEFVDASSGTAYFTGDHASNNSGVGTQYWFGFNTNNATDVIQIGNSLGTVVEQVAVASVNQAVFNTFTGGAPVNTTEKASLSWAANDFAGSWKAQGPSTDASGTVPSTTKLWIGQVFADGYLFGHLSKFDYEPLRRSNKFLTRISG